MKLLFIFIHCMHSGTFICTLMHTHTHTHAAIWWGARDSRGRYCHGPSRRLPWQHLRHHVSLLGDGASWETELHQTERTPCQDLWYDGKTSVLTAIFYCKLILSLVPRPHPLWGKGSGDIGALFWLCAPTLHHPITRDHHCYFQR